MASRRSELVRKAEGSCIENTHKKGDHTRLSTNHYFDRPTTDTL